MATKIDYLCLQATRQGQASHAHVHEIIRGLEKRGWEVTLFEPNYAQNSLPPSIMRKFCQYILVQLRLWCRSTPGRLLYVRYHPAALVTALWAKIRGIPVVQEVNGPYDELALFLPWGRTFRRSLEWTMRLPLVLASSVIVVTPGLRQWVLAKSLNSDVCVIPNAANTDLFHPGARLHFEVPKPFVVFYGALAAWQGIDTIIAALREPDWPSNLNLVIAGDGVERPKVEHAGRNDKRVVYLGSIPYSEVPGLIGSSIASLIPKNNAGGHLAVGLSPLKLYESLACGTPVIVTDISGPRDIVRKHGCGLVVPLEDPGALAKAVAWMRDNPEQREVMGNRGRRVILAKHTWDCRAALTSEVLAQVSIKG